jgi:hypothetical protein
VTIDGLDNRFGGGVYRFGNPFVRMGRIGILDDMERVMITEW